VLTPNKRYAVRRTSHDGAVWDGVAVVVESEPVLRVKETGVWKLANGKTMPGEQALALSEGLLEVIHGFAVHTYTLRAVVGEEWFWRGDYTCGDDDYHVACTKPTAGGWKLRFDVAGPSKNAWQVVEYRQQG
jgi:hypothetical protein